MPNYRIAGLTVELLPKYSYTKELAEPYKCSSKNAPLFSVEISDNFIKKVLIKHSNLKPEIIEHIYLAYKLYINLLDYGRVMLHSSAIEYKGNAYLFCAKSGGGKSTHTKLWQSAFGEENVHIINDDKPIVYINDNGEFIVCGSPFAGCTDININTEVPLGGVVFLHKSNKILIDRINSKEIITNLLCSTPIKKIDEKKMNFVFTFCEKLIQNVPCYKMNCTDSVESAIEAEKTIVI